MGSAVAGQGDGRVRVDGQQSIAEGIEQASTSADLSRLLRQLRRRDARRRGDSELTYRELATMAGWSQAAVGEYFTGKTLPPTDRFDILVGLLGATPVEHGLLATLRDRLEDCRRTASGPGVPAAGRLPVPRQLPVDVSGFAGRTHELAILDKLLADGSVAAAASVWVVSGTAGVGKTALVVHWAHRVSAEFPDGQLYIDLRGFDPAGPALEPGEAVRAFVQGLGIAAPEVPVGLAAQAALYRSVLASRRVLVILDNARDAEQVRPLLPSSAGCLAVVTSRNRLLALVAHEGAQPLPLTLMSRAQARELLDRRLGRQRTDTAAAAVADIVTACAGLPLALALVAARAATHPAFSLDTLAAELRDAPAGLEPFEGEDSGAGVRRVLFGSYRTLGDPAARIFRLLGLHPGPDISLPAAASLAGVPVRELAGLINELLRCHLVAEPAPRRYACHDLLRAYAQELSRATDAEAARREALHRLLDHYLHTAQAAGTLLFPHREPVALPALSAGVVPEQFATAEHARAWLVTEHGALLSAVRRAADAHLDAHGWRLAGGIADFLHRQGHWHDHVATQRIALACAQRAADRRAEAHCHRELARAWARLGRYDDAHDELRQALRLFVGLRDEDGRARTYHSFGWLLGLQGRHAAARDHELQALTLFRAVGQRHGEASALNTLGWCHAHLGDHRQALLCCRQAAALQRDHGDRWGLTNTLDSLGMIHDRLGEPSQAASCYREAIDLCRELGDRFNEAATLINLGDVHRGTGDSRAARSAWRQAALILDELGHPDLDVVRAKLGEPR